MSNARWVRLQNPRKTTTFVVGHTNTMVVVSSKEQLPVTSALKLRIESSQLDVEERFYRSMKRVARASKSAAICTHSEQCIDGEIQVYSARVDAPIKQEFIDSAQKLYYVKAKAERDNCQTGGDLARLDGLSKVKRLSPHDPRPLSRDASFWSYIQDSTMEVRDTFDDGSDHRVLLSSTRTTTFDDDDDILEGRRLSPSIQSDEQEPNLLFSFVGEVCKTFDDDDLPASAANLPDMPQSSEPNLPFSFVGEICKTFDDDDLPASPANLPDMPQSSVWTGCCELAGDFYQTFND